MRKRFALALLAAPATLFAGVGMMAGPATAAAKVGPVLGPVIATTGMAGYQTSGKQFRFITSTIMVPDHQSDAWSDTCTISAAPSFVVTLSGAATITIHDNTTGQDLVEGVDYTETNVGLVYTETLIDSGNWKASDVLAVSVSAGTFTLSAPSGGTIGTSTFVPSSPVATCSATVLPAQVTVFDVTENHGLAKGTDFTTTTTGLFSVRVNLIASGAWGFGDTLRVTGLVWHSAYIQLSNGSLGTKAGQYARTGIEPCAMAQVASNYSVSCTLGEWVAFIETYRNATSPWPRYSHYVPLDVSRGDGVGFHIYYNQGGDELFFDITPPGAATMEFQTGGHGALFNYAAALTDTTNLAGDPVVLPAFLHLVKIDLFVQGAVTTYAGSRGSFIGSWTTSPVVATSNGLPFPSGTTRVTPSQLFSDGLSANGAIRSWDAFGVFLR